MTKQHGGITQYTKALNGRPTLGFLTTEEFLVDNSSHWLGVVDRARERDVNLFCFPGMTLHSPSYD